MKKAIVYDFDKTIYSKETSTRFMKYFLLKKPQYIPKFLLNLLMSIFFINNLEKVKNIFFSTFKNTDLTQLINDFWKIELKNIYPYFHEEIKLNKKTNYSLILISASPDFLINPIGEILGFDIIISTQFDKDFKMIGKNCKGIEKVNRLNKVGNYEIDTFYSDSISDYPLFKLAKNCYTIKNGIKIEGIPKDKKWTDKWGL